jgi:hypothetical protein
MYANDMLAKNPKVFQGKGFPKTALSCENDRFRDELQKLPNGSVYGLGSVLQPVPKTMPPNKGGALRAPTLLRKP